MRKALLFASVLTAFAAFAAVPTVSDVVVSQDPGSRLVTVTYKLNGAAAVVTAELTVGGQRMTYGALASLSGDVNRRVASGDDVKRFSWLPERVFAKGELDVDVTAWSVFNPPDYMCVPTLVTNGVVNYYAGEDQIPFDKGATNELMKSEYLLMRKIPARNVVWTMGRAGVTSGITAAHKVKLTQNYYIGVFPVTQQQHYFLTNNGAPIDVTAVGYETSTRMKPMTNYNEEHLRGALTDAWRGWPQKGHDVLPGSQLDLIRQKTGLPFDLPTSAQWEFACRAGSGNDYYGNLPQSSENLKPIAWFKDNADNGSSYMPVGLKKPNAWGLYDTLGNAWEATLDWHDGTAHGDETDPVGPRNDDKSLTKRQYRGGSSANSSGECTCWYNFALYDTRGFRLWLPCYAPGEGVDGEEGEGVPVKEVSSVEQPVRILLIGDSITGQSRNHADGFAKQMDAALMAVHPTRTSEVVALGYSGSHPQYWRQTLLPKSETDDTLQLDVKGVFVKAELDRAEPDWLVVNLGMNDLLAPHQATEAKFPQWQEDYAWVVDYLIGRCRPKRVALCSVTPCTELATSPKNAWGARLNAWIREYAHSRGYGYVASAEGQWELLERGRRLDGSFHVTWDRVHPNTVGHYNLAASYLRGIGDAAAADWVVRNRVEAYLRSNYLDNAPVLSLRFAGATPAADGRFSFALAYCETAADGTVSLPQPEVTVPDGWQVVVAGNGSLTVVGAPDRLRNTVSIRAGGRMASVDIPAPWQVVCGIPMPYWSVRDGVYSFDNAAAAANERCDIGFAGHPWTPYFATEDILGETADGNVDYLAITHAEWNEGGFGRRRVWSDAERDVTLRLSHMTATFFEQVQVYVNGVTVMDEQLQRATADKTAVVHLKAGWNDIGFRSAHYTWQWQHALALEAIGADGLDGLRYALP